MTNRTWAARVANANLANLIAAANAVNEIRSDTYNMMVRPVTSGLRWWNGVWCLYHEVIVDAPPVYIEDFEIVGVMNKDGKMRALPGNKVEDLPVAPLAVRWEGSLYGMTVEYLIHQTCRPTKVARQVRYAEAVLKFMRKEGQLTDPDQDEPLFSEGPVSTMFLIACVLRYTRNLYAFMKEQDNGYEPPEADEIAHSFINEPWSELENVHPLGEDYLTAGAFMAHLFEMDARHGHMPRLSELQNWDQFDTLAGYAVSFYTRDLEPIR